MQFRWEAKDIKGGRLLKTAALTDAMIGWQQHREVLWGIIDCRDGMFLAVSTDKDAVAAHLNNYRYVPLTLD